MACMGLYQYGLCEELSEMILNLPDDKSSITRHLQKERGMLLAKQQLNSSKNTLGIFTKTVTLVIMLSKHARLRCMSLMEDVPFNDEGLFSAMKVTGLQEMDKSIKILHNHSISTSSCPSKCSKCYWANKP